MKTMLTHSWKSLYLDINVFELLFSINQNNAQSSLYLETLSAHNLSCITSTYFKFYIPKSHNNEIISNDSVQLLLYHLVENICGSDSNTKNHLKECTFELSNRQFDIAFLEVLFMLSYNANQCFDNKKLVILKNIVFRLSLPWQMCKYFDYALYLQSHSQFSVVFDCRISISPMGIAPPLVEFIEKNLHIISSKFVDAIHDKHPKLNEEYPIAHFSFEWNIKKSHRKIMWKYVCELFQIYGFYPYQYWHFSKQSTRSIYLCNIYAMHSYLGLPIGTVPNPTISWMEGDNKIFSCMGTSKNNRKINLKNSSLKTAHNTKSTSSIVWKKLDSVEELELRIMQAQDSEILRIPEYLQNKLQQKFNSIHNNSTKNMLKTLLYERGFSPIQEEQIANIQNNVFSNVCTTETVWVNDISNKF